VWSVLERIFRGRGGDPPQSEQSIRRGADEADIYTGDLTEPESGATAAPTEDYPRDLTNARPPTTSAKDD
jgi:hypothetical protein